MELDLSAAYDKVYSYCYFKLRHVQTAEDITQEAFLKYLRQKELMGKTSIAYLYTIAKNLCIDYYRKHKEQPFVEEPADLTVQAQLDTTLAVKAAVNSLPESLQELVLLRYANDLKLGDIAEITGQSRFAVRRKLQEAMALLKNQLKEEP